MTEYTYTQGDKPLSMREVEDQTDLTHDVPFHTIGRGPTQAAAGNHHHDADYLEPEDVLAGANVTIDYAADGTVTINGSDPGSPLTDHGALSGRSDDDHPQYLTPARANTVYSPLGHGHSGFASESHTHVQSQSHNSPDTDLSPNSLHHTLGTTANEAAAGNHTHSGFAPTSHTHTQAQSHGSPDTNASAAALHHTLGTGSAQAAAGNHVHTAGQAGIRTFRIGPYTVQPDSYFEIARTKFAGEMIFATVQHPSGYIFVSIDDYLSTSFTVRIRNSTLSTTHTNVFIHLLQVDV